MSYDNVKLDALKLTYYTISKDNDEDLRTGVTKIQANGEFKIRMRRLNRFPYWVVISGVDAVPEVSVENNSYEITNSQETEIDMGEVYIFDQIEIQGDFSHPLRLRDLRIQWKSNIPNVGFYRVKLLGQITVSGIRGNSFSFGTLGPALKKEGRFRVEELEIVTRSDRTEGTFLLDVEAVRLISGKPVTVGGSSERTVTISGD